MIYKTPVLRMLLDVSKTCVYERTYPYIKHVLLNLHVYHALNVLLTCVLKNACHTHVAHFPV